MIRKILIAMTFFAIGLPAQAIDGTEETAIKSTIQKYFDGYASGDVAMLKEAFHESVVIK